MEPIHEEVYKGYKIEIIQDEDATSPREDECNLGHMICFHNRYTLGDKHDLKHEDYDGWDAMADALRTKFKAVLVLPLFLYDHSGITMSTGRFSCPWDSGQVGFIYTTAEDIREAYGVKHLTKGALTRALAALESEVKVYDSYLKGEVYGYRMTYKNGNELDSCWGYYGDYDDKEYSALTEARSVVDVHEAHLLKEKMTTGIPKTGEEK